MTTTTKPSTAQLAIHPDEHANLNGFLFSNFTLDKLETVLPEVMKKLSPPSGVREDVGIGPYEYFGAVGYDERWENRLEDNPDKVIFVIKFTGEGLPCDKLWPVCVGIKDALSIYEGERTGKIDEDCPTNELDFSYQLSYTIDIRVDMRSICNSVVISLTWGDME